MNDSKGQVVSNNHRIFFVSDVQSPLRIEKLILANYRNEDARDSLLEDIVLQAPENVFLLGDLTSNGSREKAWVPMDKFLNSLRDIGSKVYAIPGNHEYMFRSFYGMRMFTSRFNEDWLYGYSVNVDSIAVVMLNSNFSRMSKDNLSKQLLWYKSEMDSLDASPEIKAIVVCTHHPPYSNSMVVGSYRKVQDLIVPVFEKSKKSKLFISGHSHNLEYFTSENDKKFLIIGGGGGPTQPLIPPGKRIYTDMLKQDVKPLYFYLIIEIQGNGMKLIGKGFKRDFRFFELEIGRIDF